ncbi:beta-ketoacyl synthase N-terminal-like domain-containing protein [Geomonas agri]|uniref:beta-ketoacyl synthase N-terminal-like domain-containing protein n=1 Tax=Geomonas agri TaxID=2873702 RepID=UPI001CD7160B|nr:beta-ketoacyl synthase N-terminal-like domain-containing protein [Geomonas agri]
MKQQSPSVAIVGLGGIFPDAPELTTFWENIRNAKSAAREVPAGRWALAADAAFHPEAGKPDHVYSKRGCFIDSLPPLSSLSGLHIDSKLADGLDPAFQLLLHAGKRAFDSAVTAKLDRSRIGVIIGNLALPSEKSAELSRALLGRTFEEKLLGHAGNDPIPNPLNRYVAGLPAGLLAAALGLGGGCSTLDAACASSLYAIKLACDELLSGRADAMLTGGLSRPDPLYTQMGFAQLRALSRRGICSPFDASGDGLVVGEGAGIFVLKRLDDAIAQGDRIYGVIKGIGLSNDVGGSLLAPMADGQLRAMRSAYEKAGWQPQDVDLIECHATGTPVGDATEVGSLRELWGDVSGKGCVIGSVKSNIGHLLTAAGSAALTKVLLAMAEETLPPTANFKQAPENFRLEESPFKVLQGATPWQRRADGVPRRAAVSAFGFGGINAHLLVEEWLPSGASAVAAEPPKKGGPVAVVGLDARFGKWQDLKSFQSRALGGDTGAKTSQPKDWWGAEQSAWFATEKLKDTPFSGYYLDEFAQPTDQFRIPPKELEEMLPQQLLMLQSAAAAIKDAGMDRADNLCAGVFVGIALDLNSTNFAFRWTIADKAKAWARQLGLKLSPEQLEQWVEQLRDQAGPALTANRTMGALGSVVASRVAREFRCGGPSFTMSSEESSGLRALETAVRQLQSNEIDRAIVGAVDLAGDFRAVIGQHLNRPYSGFGSATPFDQSADGTVVGEGAATVILKRLEDAERDGDRIYAVIGGVGSASGEVMLPGVPAYRHALERAYGEAEVAPASIGLIEAHGSGNAAEDRMEAAALTEFFDEPGPAAQSRRLPVASVKADIGHTGAASGLASLVRGCLALYQEIIPGTRSGERPVSQLSGNGALFLPNGSRYWLRNRSEGARHAGVSVFGVDGSVSHVVLQGYENVPERTAVERVAPLAGWDEFLFSVTGADRQELADGVRQLRETAEKRPAPDMAVLSRRVCKESSASGAPLAVSMVARSADELASLCQQGERILRSDAAYAESVLHPSQRDRLFFTANPIGKNGKIGFVYPGSGNHFAGMGMELSARWPEVYRRQDAENLYLREQFQPEQFWNGASIDSVHENHLAVIFGQVATGCAVTDVVQRFGIKPNAVISYSLGESAGLFATRTWTERDLMLTRMKASTLFTRDLAGECRAAREAWGEPDGKEINWSIGVVDAPAREVRRALKKTSRVYLLIVNTPDECVIGGDVKWVKHLVAMLDCRFFPLQGVTTVHCEVARQVSTAYRDLHVFNTNPPAGVTFYSGAAGSAYQVNRRSAAESILAQAVEGIDYPKVIEAAYGEGIRYFIEMGPGASCSRMIGRILNNRPHVARSVCQPGTDANSGLLRLLAQLTSERVPVDLDPLFVTTPDLPVQASVLASELKGIRFSTGGAPFAPSLPQAGQAAQVTVVAATSAGVKAPAGPHVAQQPSGIPAPATTGATVMPGVNNPVSTTQETAANAGFTPASPAIATTVSAVSQSVSQPTQSAAQFKAAPAPVAQAPAVEPVVDPLLSDFARARDAHQQAHDTYLRVANDLSRSIADALSLQISIQEQMLAAGIPVDQDLLNQTAYTGAMAAAGASERQIPSVSPSQRGGREARAAFDGGSAVVPTSTTASAPATALVSATAPVPAPYPGALPALYDYDMCLEFAIGSVAKMLGPEFAEADSYPTRVRLPDVPLQLVHRIVALEGEPKSMTSGRVVTQHDVHPGAWYLDGNRIPTCIAVEAGQADLFLSGYLGIDFITKGLAVYRLLDAVVTFHRELPAPGETINYDIRIERFFRQGETCLFRFHFEATVNGQPLLSMRNGCAGFFSQEELDAGKGIVRGAIDLRPKTGKLPADWQYLVPMQPASYDARQLDALRCGDLAGCFGPLFSGLPIQRPLTIPGGRMELVHRVMELVPDGGRCGLGFIRAEADIHPDDWFITCHFVDDRVMPGTLMYECCMHTLRIFLLRLGWVAEADGAAWQPVPGVASQLCCRGQVLETTKVVTYEVTVRELGYRPEPYAIVDALMYADGKPIVEITNMSARLTGTNREALLQLWQRNRTQSHNVTPAVVQVPAYDQKPAIYTKQQILAYSNGNPSEGFGDRYKVFDNERKIARLPGPPFQFMDRVTGIKGEPWQMVPGAMAEAQYDIPVDEWYFAADRQPRMPFAVLLEAALQPCGWLAAYVGSALTSPTDISFRNLGGTAVQHRPVTPDSGTLTATATLTKAATSGGMIIQEFDFSVADRHGVLYEGDTMFGFFAKEALANQVGIREAVPYIPSAEEAGRGRSIPYPEQRPFPDKMLRMIDRIDLYVADGGPAGLGYIRGTKTVVTEDWYFKAHFYEDPVTPGSLGLESFLQLMKFAAVERWGWNEGDTVAAVALERKHRWLYRGQVVPTDKEVTVMAWITAVDDANRVLTAAGFLYVDGRAIYQMNDFTVQLGRG